MRYSERVSYIYTGYCWDNFSYGRYISEECGWIGRGIDFVSDHNVFDKMS